MAKKQENGSDANLGFESQLWKAADALRDELLPKNVSGQILAGSDGKMVSRAAL